MNKEYDIEKELESIRSRMHGTHLEQDMVVISDAINLIKKSKEGFDGSRRMDKQEVVDMLKEMQIATAKCQGFIVGHVTQAWVIRNLLGKKIEELGGTPYIIQDDKLVDTEG